MLVDWKYLFRNVVFKFARQLVLDKIGISKLETVGKIY